MKSSPVVLLCLLVGLAYAFSNPRPNEFFTQTFVIARAMLEGRIGVDEPRPWLELVPGIDEHYSVFPLGAVLCMLPLAILARFGLFAGFPTRIVAMTLAFAIALLAVLIARRYEMTKPRRLILFAFFMFGNWMWCNLAFNGAWQYALGFAVLGQLGALYFLLWRDKPFVAGICYAIAFGNRLELLVLTPLFVWLVLHVASRKASDQAIRIRALTSFFAIPAALLALTMTYNHARFGTVWDTGHGRIPYVADQPGYQAGLLNLNTVPINARVMLFTPWRRVERFPFFVPNAFGDSILWASPFLLLSFRRGARDVRLKRAAWIAILIVTFILWTHGNPGGYQFSYRYAMDLLPWFYLVLLESGGVRQSLPWKIAEVALLCVSLAINAFAVYFFYWTQHA
ncbi:MAG: hypothetical protein JXO72_12015 [Vicinamibacteria bacterium]|nr:hypothetical protein [Vicinamibacteria bacterium]